MSTRLPKDHPMLKPGYEVPEAPGRFDQPCAFRFPDGHWVLDFISHERRDYATESMNVFVEWPWLEGHEPVDADWRDMGSTPILRTLQKSLIIGKRSVYVEEKKVQPRVQTRCH
jgi:hypothetical protein